MPSDFISLLSADLDLNSPKSLYSKGKTYSFLLRVLCPLAAASCVFCPLRVVRRGACSQSCNVVFSSYCLAMLASMPFTALTRVHL